MLREGQNCLRARLQQLKSNERNGGYEETVMELLAPIRVSSPEFDTDH
jgi:hypothetical protein